MYYVVVLVHIESIFALWHRRMFSNITPLLLELSSHKSTSTLQERGENNKALSVLDTPPTIAFVAKWGGGRL